MSESLVLVGGIPTNGPNLDKNVEAAICSVLGQTPFDVGRSFYAPMLGRALRGTATFEEAERVAAQLQEAGLRAQAALRSHVDEFMSWAFEAEQLVYEAGVIRLVDREGATLHVNPASLVGMWLGKQTRQAGTYETEHATWQASPQMGIAGIGVASRRTTTESHSHDHDEFFLVLALRGETPLVVMRSSRIQLDAGGPADASTRFEQFARVVKGLRGLRPDVELDRTLERTPEFPGLELLGRERLLERVGMLQAMDALTPFGSAPAAPVVAAPAGAPLDVAGVSAFGTAGTAGGPAPLADGFAHGGVASVDEAARNRGIDPLTAPDKCTRCDTVMQGDDYYLVDARPWCTGCAEKDFATITTARGQLTRLGWLLGSVTVFFLLMLTAIYWVNMWIGFVPGLGIVASVYWFGFAAEADRDRLQKIVGGREVEIPSLFGYAKSDYPALVYGGGILLLVGTLGTAILSADPSDVYKLNIRKSWDGPTGVKVSYVRYQKGVTGGMMAQGSFGDARAFEGLDSMPDVDEEIVRGGIIVRVINGASSQTHAVTPRDKGRLQVTNGVKWTLHDADDDIPPMWIKIKVLEIGPATAHGWDTGNPFDILREFQ